MSDEPTAPANVGVPKRLACGHCMECCNGHYWLCLHPTAPAPAADFWERCIEHHVVIVPFKAHTDYDASGNYSAETLIGTRFVGLENEAESRLDDLYISFETSISRPRDGTDIVGMTPEEALEKYIAWNVAMMQRPPGQR